MLLLADYEGMKKKDLKDYICADFEVSMKELNRFDILIAYKHVGSWGCDSSAWFLLREKASGKLFENSGGHCSCYGFEGQFEPGETSKAYLVSDKFYFSHGGYDDENHTERVVDYIKRYVRD